MGIFAVVAFAIAILAALVALFGNEGQRNSAIVVILIFLGVAYMLLAGGRF